MFQNSRIKILILLFSVPEKIVSTVRYFQFFYPMNNTATDRKKPLQLHPANWHFALTPRQSISETCLADGEQIDGFDSQRKSIAFDMHCILQQVAANTTAQARFAAFLNYCSIFGMISI